MATPTIINKGFTGKMNLDTQPYRVPEGDWIDALNITRDAEGRGQDIVVSNIPGNYLAVYNLPSGTNKFIGKFEDKVRNRIYLMIWNSNDLDLFIYFDNTTGSFVDLIENITDTGGDDVLLFDPSYRINHIDIIPSDLEGDKVFFTSGNSTPKKLNVKHILDADYSVIKSAFIEVAKMPPLNPPICIYGSDTTRNSNALRRKLFQFTQQWKYDDFESSSFSTYSKIPLPIGYYGSDNDLDNTSNNFITITVNTGDENVTDIIIAMRSNIGDAWSDFVNIGSLNKAQLNIPDNTTYQFLFYNDALYPPIDQGAQYVDGVQTIPLFYWVPQLAYNQVLGNGNIPVYSAITEGYDNYPVNDLQVTITAANVTNIPPDADPPSITYIQSGMTFSFTVNGSVPIGTRYRILIFFNGTGGQTAGVRVVGDYTSISGDSVNIVANILYNQFNSYPSNPIITGSYAGDGWSSNFGTIGSYVFLIDVFAGPSTGVISTEKTWMWDSNYVFGIVYVDEQNRDMPGVTTFADPINSDNDFVVTTPSISFDGTAPQTPVISASINHLPPAGAVKYYWVRRRQTYGSFLYYETCDFQEDADYYYFCLANIELYKEDNSQFIYGTAPITSESRIRVVAEVDTGAYNGTTWTQDYQILGTVIKTLTGGSSPDDDRAFIKVKIPTSTPTPAYSVNMLVLIYTPMLNPTSAEDSVYWEWGEAYDIYTSFQIIYSSLTGVFTVGETITGNTSGATAIVVEDDGINTLSIRYISGEFIVGETIVVGPSVVTATIDSITEGLRYHAGLDQDQTIDQPATFTWEEGDVYYHERTMYEYIVGTARQPSILSIMDANFSDFFDSAVNDNGRGQAIEKNAKRQFNPTLIRNGGAYQSGTNISDTNVFYPEDFDEYDRSNGMIRRMFVEGRRLFIFQEFDIGIVPVLTQIVRDTAGNPLEANSDVLLNKITYPYLGKYGIGNVPESFAYGKGAKYGFDNNKGVYWRLSGDGITPLSILYECNAFFIATSKAYNSSLNNGNPETGQPYLGNPTVYSTFNEYTNRAIIAFEEINRYDSDGNLTFHQDAFTLSFAETRNSTEGFESFYSYNPEMMGCLNNLLFTGKNGQLWLHDGGAMTNFYGTQYGASITPVFNQNALQKKTYTALSELSNAIWACPEIITQLLNQSGQPQTSNLGTWDFKLKQGQYHATIKRDAGFGSSKYNGHVMKGNYMIIKFEIEQTPIYVYLNVVSLKYIISYLTTA